MIEITIPQAVVACVAAMGIPGAITGLAFWYIKKKIENRDQKQESAEHAREELETLNVQATLASVTLAEATARAVKRIPDAHCNGDMDEALSYATSVKNELRDFLRKQGVRAVVK